jgi:hypothetical protein
MNEMKNAPDCCCVCGKNVSNGWFARIHCGTEWIKVCSPMCSIRYTDGLLPTEDEYTNESATGNLRPRFLVNGELWS